MADLTESRAAWDSCERGDWLLRSLGRLSGPVGSPSRKKLVMAACACARLSMEFVPPGEDRPRLAVDAAEDYARGGPTTLDQVRAAGAAASAAASAAAAARKRTLKACADLVRGFYPTAPLARREND